MKRKTATLTLYNDFHDSKVTVWLRNGCLTKRQTKRAKRVLCGIPSCSCSDESGIRGFQCGIEQATDQRLYWEVQPDGSCLIWDGPI